MGCMTELTLVSPLSLGPASLDDVRVRPYGLLENRQARAAIAAAWPAARPVWHDGSARFHLPLLPPS